MRPARSVPSYRFGQGSILSDDTLRVGTSLNNRT